MKIKTKKLNEAIEKAKEMIESAEDKSQAIVDAVEMIASVQNEDLIKEIQEQAASVSDIESEKDYCNRLGLRILSNEEKEFWQKFINDPKQAVTGDQADILPTTFVDVTLEDVKKSSNVLKYINFAPANVRKWISASKTGAFSWGGLTESIKGELKASFSTIDMEVSKLTVYMVIPKALRDLALPFVEKYCRAILVEQLIEGEEYGFFQGNGVNEPIGILKDVKEVNADKTAKDKDVNIIESFTPKGLANLKNYLENDGKRVVTNIVLFANSRDYNNYVAPAMFDDEGKNISSDKNIIPEKTNQLPEGKSVFFVPKKYTMGMTNLGFKDYDQTLAMDDNDVVIGKGYSNGRADDNYCSFVIDPSHLKEYVKRYKNVSETEASEDSEITGA